MPQLIKLDQQGRPALLEDSWQLVDAGQLSAQCGPCILPLELWLQAPRNAADGLWLNGGDRLELLGESGALPPLIAVHFPRLADGRGFSTARLLRGRYGFGGELRAIGHFMSDQLFYLRRCGFDAFAPSERDEATLRLWLGRFEDLRAAYQGGADALSPLLRQEG